MTKKKVDDTFVVGDVVVPIKEVDCKGRRIIKYDKEYIITNIFNKQYVSLSALRNGKFYHWAILDIKNIKKVDD